MSTRRHLTQPGFIDPASLNDRNAAEPRIALTSRDTLHGRISRRRFIGGLASLMPVAAGLSLASGISGCVRHRYVRPAGELMLGTVRELLYSVVHVRPKAALVYRDVDGWRALSTRCTYQGCDLTFQEENLFCPCCKSYYDHEGRLYPNAKAQDPLPWMTMFYREGKLYAEPGKPVAPTYRFTTPEIEEAVRKLRERIKEEGLADEVKVPRILMGEGDAEPGTMFVEEDPNLEADLNMIK